jgi:hypothetical protein
MRIARYELDNGCRYLARWCSAPRGLTRHARGMHAALTAVLAHARHSAALASEGRPAWMAEQYGDNVRTPDSHLRRTLAWLIPTYGALPRTYDVLPLSVYSHLQSSEAIEARRKAEQAKLDELRAKVCPNLNRILVPLFPSIRTLDTNIRTLISEYSYPYFRILVPLLRTPRTVVSEYSYPCYEILVPLSPKIRALATR